MPTANTSAPVAINEDLRPTLDKKLAETIRSETEFFINHATLADKVILLETLAKYGNYVSNSEKALLGMAFAYAMGMESLVLVDRSDLERIAAGQQEESAPEGAAASRSTEEIAEALDVYDALKRCHPENRLAVLAMLAECESLGKQGTRVDAASFLRDCGEALLVKRFNQLIVNQPGE